ncbi:MAG: peptide/nickel transport system permease protein [Ilumatobacteraceae bacterium]|jgi:peptide/nickel transport system permease protein
MPRYIAKRLFLSLITLWLLTTIVFLMVKLLPGDPARSLSGNTAPEAAVEALRVKLGLKDSFFAQYFRVLKGLVTLDFGHSWKNQRSEVWGALVGPALFRSSKLAGLAMLITAPLAIGAGIIAARKRDTLIDRGIVMVGLATSSIPEFVTGALLAVAFGLNLHWLKPIATIPRGASVITQLHYLLLPALAMAIVYFGYIARMMRSGAAKALESDYARTATMKGLTDGQVMRKHVLRNAMAPTITVMSVQIGYLFGGIIGVEAVTNYQGLSTVILNAATNKDLPVLMYAVIVIAAIYMMATLFADLLIAWLNPRARLDMDAA